MERVLISLRPVRPLLTTFWAPSAPLFLVETTDPPTSPRCAGRWRRALPATSRPTSSGSGAMRKRGQEMLDPHPRVVLVPGLGMWTAGRDVRATTVTADIYRHTISIMAGAEAVDRYVSLSPEEAYKAEYWPQELYKLSLLPPESELSRRIALITGAAHGIGQAIARRFAAEGAHLVLTDVDYEGVEVLSAQLNEEHGGGWCTAVRHDVTSEAETAAAVRHAALAYGGLDILVSNAGIAPTGALDELEIEDWQRSLQVNATGHLLVAREAVRLMREQGFGGSLVFIATKNVLAPGRGFGAYSAAKSAQVQVARVLAMENGAYGIRSNIVNPDAVFQGSGLWSPELRRERCHGPRYRRVGAGGVLPEAEPSPGLYHAHGRGSGRPLPCQRPLSQDHWLHPHRGRWRSRAFPR